MKTMIINMQFFFTIDCIDTLLIKICRIFTVKEIFKLYRFKLFFFFFFKTFCQSKYHTGDMYMWMITLSSVNLIFYWLVCFFTMCHVCSVNKTWQQQNSLQLLCYGDHMVISENELLFLCLVLTVTEAILGSTVDLYWCNV